MGMVRVSLCAIRRDDRFPHARGDGPVVLANDIGMRGFSPRPWGWSAMRILKLYGHYVFPTPVGMVRVDGQ